MKTKTPSTTQSRTQDDRASYAQHFVIHQKIPEALITREPTISPPEGLDTRGPTQEPTLEPTPYPTISPSATYNAIGPTNLDADVTGRPSASSGIIGGHAFFDSNNNGMYDADDNGIDDVMTWLLSCNGELVANGKTSSGGFFNFENLAPGNYFVVIQLPSGYVTATVWDATIFDTAESQRRDTNCRTICFKIQEGETSNVELSFGMQFAPTSSPSPRPSEQPSSNPSVSFMPNEQPSISPDHYHLLRPKPRPSYAPSLSILPSTIPSEMPSSSGPSIFPTAPPSNSQQPSFESSQYPTRYGESVGPIQTNGLRITLFGIDKVQNEAEWSDGTALYINRYFNSEWNYAFDVDADIVLTKQTAKLNSVDDYIYGDKDNSARTRQLQDQISVEIVYNQISTYKTIDPTFTNIAYILQEPFATTLSRHDYISFLQILSPNFANISSVSPVVLPHQREASPNNGIKSGLGFGIFLFIGIILVLVVQSAFIYCERRRRKSAQPEKKGSEKEKKDSERSDSVPSPNQSREVQPSHPLTGSLTTYATRTSITHSNCSEVIIDVIVPPGRVGCIIDSSTQRGPYICEIHEFSPLKDELQLGDRILAVDGEDVRQMSAMNVSKLLGSRSENEEREMTVLREFFYDASVDESKSRDSLLDDADEESKTVISLDPPGVTW